MIEIVHLPVEQIVVTSGFGMRTFGGKKEHHNGVDLAPKVRNVEGDMLYAVQDGTVVLSKAQGGTTSKGYGYYMVIEHMGFCTLYGHMKALGLAVGTKVKAGQVVGYMGNTGQSTGVHVHFEIREGQFNTFWKSGDYNRYINSIDPYPIMENYIKTQKDLGDPVIFKPNSWLQKDGEAAIRRLDLMTYGDGHDLLNSPDMWIKIINNPVYANELFKDTSDLVAFMFIMLDRISQKSA